MKADIVIPSLDAGNEQLFQYVNRPHKDISFERVIQGLIDFSKQFTGHIWLEILLLSGINGMAEEVKEMAAWVNKIHIEKVQINTVSRPAYEDFAHPVDVRQLQKLARLFLCPVDILQNATSSDLSGINGVESSDKDILDLLDRRPCTLEESVPGWDCIRDVAKKLKSLLDKRLIIAMRAEQGLFYKIAERK